MGPRKEGGGDAEEAKNRGVPAHSPKAGIRLPAACGVAAGSGGGEQAQPPPQLRLALLLFVSQPYGDRKRPQGWGTMAHSLGARACRAAIGDAGQWPGGEHGRPAPPPWELAPREMMGCTGGMQGDLPQPIPLTHIPVRRSCRAWACLMEEMREATPATQRAVGACL